MSAVSLEEHECNEGFKWVKPPRWQKGMKPGHDPVIGLCSVTSKPERNSSIGNSGKQNNRERERE